MKKTSILGIRVSTFKKEKILKKIKKFVLSSKKHFILTPNPEIILNARNDEELFYILNSANLSIADGMGIKFAGFLNQRNLTRITGADLTKHILNLCQENDKRVGILSWRGGLSSKKDIEKSLKKQYPKLKAKAELVKRDKNAELSKELLDFKPQILFVGLGSPWQEKFIYHNIEKISSVTLAMGIGGSFDFITGKTKRAPKIFRMIGLEWLWRAISHPRDRILRLKRVSNAVFYFSYRVLRNKLFCPFFYRPNVACLLYKKVSRKTKNNNPNQKDDYKIFIVERQNEPEHWQLPQGGTRGEKPIKAGERELSEETNCNKFIPKRVFKNVYRYKFGGRPGETLEQVNSKRKYTGFKGQKQDLFIAEFTGEDKDIKINFWDHSAWKWVDLKELEGSVHLVRKRATQRFIKKFKEMMKIKP